MGRLWAEYYYPRASELHEFGPYTSKDIDYFGRLQAAEKLAAALGGEVSTPDIGDVTPHTAIVTAEFRGQILEIDFLDTIQGVEPLAMQHSAVNLRVPMTLDGVPTQILIPVMNPVHCLQSRVANVLKLRRRTLLAEMQLQASPIIVREYVKELLNDGHFRAVHATLRSLFEYFRSNPEGRQSLRVLRHDPIGIFELLRTDERLDLRYREKTIQPMIDRLKRVRSLMWPKPIEAAGLPKPEDDAPPPEPALI